MLPRVRPLLALVYVTLLQCAYAASVPGQTDCIQQGLGRTTAKSVEIRLEVHWEEVDLPNKCMEKHRELVGDWVTLCGPHGIAMEIVAPLEVQVKCSTFEPCLLSVVQFCDEDTRH